MNNFRNVTILLLLSGLILLNSCDKKSPPEELSKELSGPSNVIFLIGDGMGLSQISTTFYFKQDGPSNFQRFNYIGLIKTSSTNAKITDSAAGGTAFACGQLTYNGAIGVDTDKQPITNITEYLSRSGFNTGLVATSSITHATPASFYAHAASRSMNELIAEQLTESEIDIFIGGGRQFFENRKDGLDMIQRLNENNFNVFYSIEELPALDIEQKYGVLAAPDGLPPVYEGRGDFLSNATEISLDYLSGSQQPFFLMIEGSQIDWGGHENNWEYMKTEMLDFDKTVGKVLDFAESHPGTLVVITADHETGGFALSGSETAGMDADDNELSPAFATGGHTATLVPVFAFGPGAERFAGIYTSAHIYHRIIQAIEGSGFTSSIARD